MLLTEITLLLTETILKIIHITSVICFEDVKVSLTNIEISDLQSLNSVLGMTP